MNSLLIVVLIILVILIFGNRNQKRKINKFEDNSSNEQISSNELLLYKKKGIKEFNLKGLYYLDLNPKLDVGNFIGIAETEYNEHDMYAIAIYNKDYKHYGYISRGNKRLNNSLEEWHNGKVMVWGGLDYNDYNDKWYGSVFLPIGLSIEQIKKIKKIFSLIDENNREIKNKINTTEKYFEILERHREIANLLQELNNPKEIFYIFPRNLIPSISKHLETEKNWKKLIELENYNDLILELSETFKKSTLNRIIKAKNKLQ